VRAIAKNLVSPPTGFPAAPPLRRRTLLSTATAR